jgi:WD40 repeat protein
MPATHDAFISYNHKADRETARVLERGLQRLARPWNRVRAMSVFRDESNLSLSPHMWPSIQGHLDGSRFLIIMACPESAASVWVNREITHFCKEPGRSESVILVLTGGELQWDESENGFNALSTAAPPALKDWLTDRPLWLDMRWARDADELSLRMSQFRSAVAQVASPIRNMSAEDLESEDVRQHRRALRLARLAVATVVVLAIVASIAAVIAVGNAHRADRRAREATGGQLGLAALDIPTSDMARALLLSVAAGQLAPQSDEATFRASRVLIGRYSKLTALLDAGAARQELSVQALALTNDASSVVALAARDGIRELLRWDLRSRGEPAALALPTGITPRLTPVGNADAVVVGEAGGTMMLADGGRLTALEGTVLALDAGRDRAVILGTNGRRALIEVLSGKVVSEIGDGLIDLAQGWLAIASDTSVHLLDSATGAEAAASAILETGVSFDAVDVGADGRAVVAVTSTGQVLKWERSGSELIAGSAIQTPPEVGNVRDLVGSADGKRALLVGSSGSAVVDLDSGAAIGFGPDETGVVEADPAARYAAVGGKQLVVWDLRSGDRVFAVPETANALAWSGPCDDGGQCRLVTAGETLDLWNPTTARRIRLSDQTNAQAVAVTPDAAVVASAGWGHAVAVWSAVPMFDDSGRDTLATAGAATSVDPVTFRIARATSATSIEIAGDGNAIQVATGPFERFVLAPNGRRLVTTAADGRVQLFDVSTGAGVTLSPSCAGDLMAVSGGGEMVAVFRSDQLIAAVCDTTSGSLIATARLDPKTQSPSVIAVDDDGSVAIGDRTGLVTVLLRAANDKGFQGRAPAIDTRSGKEPAEVRSLSIHNGVVAAGIRTPAARGAQGSVLVWPIGAVPVRFDSESSDVPAVALIGNADTVVVASRTTDASPVTLQTWETATRRRLGQAFSGLVGDIVVLGGDGTSIVGVDASGAAYRWHPAATATDEICKIVGRPLSRDEWDNELGGVLQKYAFLPVC